MAKYHHAFLILILTAFVVSDVACYLPNDFEIRTEQVCKEFNYDANRKFTFFPESTKSFIFLEKSYHEQSGASFDRTTF